MILTDVKMPGMTGLELIEAKKLNPLCKAVIISGFSEFSLVKSALTLKVEDYLLKPLSQNDIEKVFRKIVAELKAARQSHAEGGDASFLAGNEIVRILTREYSIWREYNSHTIRKLVLVLSQNAITESILSGIPHASKGEYYASISSVDDCRSRIGMITESMPDSSYRIAVGSDVFWDDDVIVSFWSAFGILSETEEGSISYYEDRRGNKPQKIIQDERRILIEKIESGDQRAIDLALKEAVGRTSTLKEDEQGYVYCALIYKLLVYFSLIDSIGEYSYGSMSFSSENPEELAQRFIDDFRRLAGMLSSRSDSNGRLLIARTKQYVRENYQDPALRLQQIADELSISYGYLSSLFAKVTGQTFKQFLIEVRMGEARNLLLSRKYRIYEIAYKVGYSNTRYFNEAFHKYYKCSPVEYLSNLRT